MRTLDPAARDQRLLVEREDLAPHEVGYPILPVDHPFDHHHLVSLEHLTKMLVDCGPQNDVGKASLVLQSEEDVPLGGGRSLLAHNQPPNPHHQVAWQLREPIARDGPAFFQVVPKQLDGVAPGDIPSREYSAAVSSYGVNAGRTGGGE